jgi:hypothetical protein
MNKQKITTALWGLLIIILGVGALAYNFGALDDYKIITAYIVAALLAVMGAAFLLAIAFQREQWFYVIPGFSLLSLGGMVYLTTLENIKPEWLGALFLGGIALGFLVIFLRNRRERWWALLQAETILIIALVGIGLGIPAGATKLVGAILFGGFAVSFFFVWLFSGHRGRFLWALILAGVLAVFAIATLASGQSQLVLLLWPVLLLIIGLFLIARVFSSDGKPQPQAVSIEEAPPAAVSEANQEEEGPAQIQLPDTMQPRPAPAPESIPEPALDEPLDVEIIEPENEDEAP